MAPRQVVELTKSPPPAASVHKPPSSPGDLLRVCANCGATMEERKCKLICRGCGYFLSCSDYY
jgi:hypothetical protein